MWQYRWLTQPWPHSQTLRQREDVSLQSCVTLKTDFFVFHNSVHLVLHFKKGNRTDHRKTPFIQCEAIQICCTWIIIDTTVLHLITLWKVFGKRIGMCAGNTCFRYVTENDDHLGLHEEVCLSPENHCFFILVICLNQTTRSYEEMENFQFLHNTVKTNKLLFWPVRLKVFYIEVHCR